MHGVKTKISIQNPILVYKFLVQSHNRLWRSQLECGRLGPIDNCKYWIRWNITGDRGDTYLLKPDGTWTSLSSKNIYFDTIDDAKYVARHSISPPVNVAAFRRIANNLKTKLIT